MYKILTSILFIASAVFIPFYFERIVLFFAETNLTGWVTGSVLIRLVVIILFTYGLYFLFKFFRRSKKLKKGWVLLIGIPLGFLTSFIVHPIYNTDYGLVNDGSKLEKLEKLEQSTDTYVNSAQFEILAFVDVGCYFCEKACAKLAANKRAGQKIAIHLFFGGAQEHIPNFLSNNNALELEYHILKEEKMLLEFGGNSFPSIYLIDPEGDTKYHWVGDEMNYSALDYLLDLEQ